MSGEPRASATIPGLTEQGEAVLRLIVREEVAAGIRQALADPICPRPCERTERLERIVSGNGASGLSGRVVTLEEQVASLVWQTRLVAAASVSAVIGLIVSLVGRV